MYVWPCARKSQKICCQTKRPLPTRELLRGMLLQIVYISRATGRTRRDLGLFVFLGLLLACTTPTHAAPSIDGTSAASRQNDSRGSVITLPARCPAHWTGFKVNKGGRYEVRVINMRNVYDFFVPVRDLRGWPWAWVKMLARPLEHRRRQPYENWKIR
jgi:hypothetical protein